MQSLLGLNVTLFGENHSENGGETKSKATFGNLLRCHTKIIPFHGIRLLVESQNWFLAAL